ncbi:5-hydroxytryptamine receptor 1 [Stomoxys calcitrans]|uniref:5-hydroxytryptamine receptor 1 n=1 Tax=Stomoxys calcitrans TaxID=35570 RepID=UPI0027E2A3BC|nr:5-hydroxytryptamine receptor 1 [Stomoxys calcitrans]XP_059218066.1 5-hydroxytryptamine receptor 1 [Stomoxys calcitrans]XP_059218067.1 5-hydroxytryptamine receptor 1 [Stomoxys calcitrans]
MDSLSQDNNLQAIKDFQKSSSASSGEFYAAHHSANGLHQLYTVSSVAAAAATACSATKNFKFHHYQRGKSLVWPNFGQYLRNFMFALLRALIYILLLLSLSDCWFQVGSAALILTSSREQTPTQLENHSSHSPSAASASLTPQLLHLPIQALIFEVDAAIAAAAAGTTPSENRQRRGPRKQHNSSNSTLTSREEQTNDGKQAAATATDTTSTLHGQAGGSKHHRHNSNNNNNHQQQQQQQQQQHSISTMFGAGAAGEKAGITASTMASLSGGPYHHGYQSHGNSISMQSITSTLSAALSTNDTEWSASMPSLSSAASASSSSPYASFTSTSLPSSVSLSSAPYSSSTSPLASATTTLSDNGSISSPATPVEFTMPAVHTVLVSIVLLFVILGTIVGNVLVCIAVCMVRKLRRPCNYLLVSLALSDLCVAVLVMPMALLYEVLEKWNFGPVLCDIWVSFDVLCCAASILNLCAISVDRYLAITKPLEYGVKRTPRRMMLCVALVWLAAACISLPPLLILGNEHVDEHGNPMCSVCQNFGYQIYATLGSFYIPLAVMLFVYYQIFRAARRIVLEEKRAQTHLQHALNGTGSPPPGHTDLDAHPQQHRHSSFGNTSLNYSTCGGALSTSHHSSGGTAGGHGGGSGSSGLLGSPHQKKLRFQLAKEKKASTTLGIIMSAFTVCWLPFFILALIRPFVESETTHVPQSLSSLFLWLGYANSLLNPIIYATLNRDFRKPFQEILYFRCSSLNTMMRENYYQDQYGEPPSQRVMLGDERHGARESFL